MLACSISEVVSRSSMQLVPLHLPDLYIPSQRLFTGDTGRRRRGGESVQACKRDASYRYSEEDRGTAGGPQERDRDGDGDEDGESKRGDGERVGVYRAYVRYRLAPVPPCHVQYFRHIVIGWDEDVEQLRNESMSGTSKALQASDALRRETWTPRLPQSLELPRFDAAYPLDGARLSSPWAISVSELRDKRGWKEMLSSGVRQVRPALEVLRHHDITRVPRVTPSGCVDRD
eukprot:549912-Hanusia_phi.AAC.1